MNIQDPLLLFFPGGWTGAHADFEVFALWPRPRATCNFKETQAPLLATQNRPIFE